MRQIRFVPKCLEGETAMHHPLVQRDCYRFSMNVKRYFPAILLFTAIVTGLFLTGCAVGPDYTKEEPVSPSQWRSELAGGLTPDEFRPEALATWWTTLNDPKLTTLVERSIKGNPDIKIAMARIRESRALRGISRAGLFPTLDASAGVTRSRSSENREDGTESTLYSTGFDAGWELDVFGGTRRSMEAAQADMEASQEDLHDAMVSMLAEVTLNYVEVRTFQARLSATKANIKTQQETYNLNESLYQSGIINELVVQQSLRTLETSRSQVPGLEKGLAAAENRLSVLLGNQPGELHPELAEEQPIPVLPATVAVGIPAEAMRQRPDIRRAERRLAAQTARIGVATSDLYPRFRLIGTIGLESLHSDNFLESDCLAWSAGPGISWKIFHGGAIRQNIAVQTARQEQALIQYEYTLLKAHEEVENVLTAYVKDQHRRESLVKAVAAAQRTVLLAKEQYQAGLVDFNNVLDAQRSLLLLEDELAQSDGAVISNLIRLYKALGGGWTNQIQEGDEPS